MTTTKLLLIIFTLVSGQDDFPKFEKDMLARYTQSEKDGIDTDLNGFMNRILVGHIAMAKNKDEDNKKTLYILALYHKHNLKLLEAVEKKLDKISDSLFNSVLKSIKLQKEEKDSQFENPVTIKGEEEK